MASRVHIPRPGFFPCALILGIGGEEGARLPSEPRVSPGRVRGRAHRKVFRLSGLPLLVEPERRFSTPLTLRAALRYPPTPFKSPGPPRPSDSYPELSHVPSRWRRVWEGDASSGNDAEFHRDWTSLRLGAWPENRAPMPGGRIFLENFANSRREVV